ncbi:hypothetical protein QUF76_08725 [Desulfobacterales bacterium HSG16]|nr:hypothetical protein [Desulfobacterales bacterium HSG16]
MRFILFVEGFTEKTLPQFFKRWLDPNLKELLDKMLDLAKNHEAATC